jgi:hypothetical protein
LLLLLLEQAEVMRKSGVAQVIRIIKYIENEHGSSNDEERGLDRCGILRAIEEGEKGNDE